MMRFYLSLCYGLLTGLAMLLCPAPNQASDRVLVLHSYHAEYDWVQGVNETLEAYLKASGISYRIFYMDTKRHPDQDWKMKAAREARELIERQAPEVVIAVDDNAQDLIVRHYAGKSPIQFVFAGVNADPEVYGYPADNVTGILERSYTDQVLSMLKKIMPSAESVVWISDNSTTAKLVAPRVRQQNARGRLPIPLKTFVQPDTFDQWRAAIRTWDADPKVSGLLIPLYHTVGNPILGQSMHPADVMRWTAAHTRKPIVGLWSFSMEDGALCAVVVDPREHGKVAALMAKQILSGKKARDLPMVTNHDGYVILNLAVAARLGLDVPFEVILSADKILE